MKNKIGISVFIFIGIVLAGLVYWDRQQSQKEKTLSSGKNRLDEILLDDLTHIEYVTPHLTVSVNKKNDENPWTITSPLVDQAETSTLDSILGAFSNLKYDRLISTDKISRWKEYGLDQPQITISFTNKSGDKQSFAVGNKTATQDAVYMADITNKKTYLANTLIFSKLRKELFDFRNKDVFTFETKNVQELTYKSSAPEFFTFKKDDEIFELKSSGLQDRPAIDSSKVLNFITDLSLLRIKSFLDNSTEKSVGEIKKSKAWFKINVVSKGSYTASRNFYIFNKQLWVEIEPNKLARLDDSSRAKLRKSLDDFSSHKIFDILPENIVSMSMSGKTLEMNSLTKTRMVDLATLEYDEILKNPRTTPSLLPPKYKLDLELNDGEKLVVKVWKSPEDVVTIKHSKSNNIYKVSNSDVNIFKDLENPLSDQRDD